MTALFYLLFLTSVIIETHQECDMEKLDGDFPRQNNGYLYVCKDVETCFHICEERDLNRNHAKCCYENCFCEHLHGEKIRKQNVSLKI
uniref:Putative sodium channel toxin Ts40 n=1 Tax=Tityus serrulatus TaxID=6887 RepID=SCX40_TITSE|nr:RecName: Full=Putative sodium channel toxin Ts40; AltName: Full=Tityustoxin-40; Flags: Precursor [Tityus serrulatus]QPD99031.1 putative sodium channel toxin Ts40 [Tityus serrulatus]